MKERNDEHQELMVGVPKIRIGPSREVLEWSKAKNRQLPVMWRKLLS